MLLHHLSDAETETLHSLSHARCQALLDETLFAYSEFQHDSCSDLSMSLQVWPLTRPGLLDEAECAGIPEEILVDLFLHDFVPHITYMLSCIHACDVEAVNQKLAEFQGRAAEDAGFRLLAKQLCPTALESSACPTNSWDMKKLKNALRLVDKVDSALFSLTSAKALDRLLFHQILNLELSDDLKVDFAVLYRATTDSTKDSTVWVDGRPHSLSFGLSLLSGIRFDRSATCYNYAQKERYRDLYAVRLPLRACLEGDGIFFIPPIPPLLQLASIGEMFHPRTKLNAPPGFDVRSFVSGILQCPAARVPDFLRIDRNPEDEFKTILRHDSVFLRKGSV